ncbi:hypothetical protein [Avibacterium endocarditidis]|uniref:hypothetical protein n=1 Tax=Avibacterium TaxID=292486 RepID=UPI0039FD991A
MLDILKEAELKLIEIILIEKFNKLKDKKEKTRLDHLMLLAFINKTKSVQNRILTIQENRNTLSEKEIEEYIAKYEKELNLSIDGLLLEKDNIDVNELI